MAADASIFSQYLKPVRSVADYAGDMDAREANQLELTAKRQSVADDNAVRKAYAQSGGDPNKIRALLQQGGSYKALNAYDKNQLDAQEARGKIAKDAAQTSHYGAQTSGLTQDQSIKTRETAIRDIASYETPAHAMASLDEHVAAGKLDPAKAQAIRQSIPQDPAQFQAWQLKMLRGIMSAKDQVELDATNTRATESNKVSRDNNIRTTEQAERGSVRTAGTAAAGREQSERHFTNTPKGQVVQTDQGVMLVNPRTGEAQPVMANGAPMQPKMKSLPAPIQKALLENDAALRKVDSALAELEAYPEGVGLKNYMGDTIRQRSDPQGVRVRALVSDIGSLKIHDRSGAAVTASETPRLKPFIPTSTDDSATIKKKLGLFREEYDQIQNDIAETYTRENGYRAPAPRKGGGASGEWGGASKPAAAGHAKVANDAEFNALPSGATFIGPDGKTRRKP